MPERPRKPRLKKNIPSNLLEAIERFNDLPAKQNSKYYGTLTRRNKWRRFDWKIFTILRGPPVLRGDYKFIIPRKYSQVWKPINVIGNAKVAQKFECNTNNSCNKQYIGCIRSRSMNFSSECANESSLSRSRMRSALTILKYITWETNEERKRMHHHRWRWAHLGLGRLLAREHIHTHTHTHTHSHTHTHTMSRSSPGLRVWADDYVSSAQVRAYRRALWCGAGSRSPHTRRSARSRRARAADTSLCTQEHQQRQRLSNVWFQLMFSRNQTGSGAGTDCWVH